MNNPCPFGGLQVLIPRNSASSTRTSWPPKYTELLLPLLDPMVVDLTERENIRVGSAIDMYPSRSPYTLRGPGIRGSQPIPNRTSRSRTPSVRTPPPGLWQITGSKPAAADVACTLTSTGVLRLSPLPPPVVIEVPCAPRRPSPQRRSSIVIQAPIGSERQRRSSTPDDLSAIAMRASLRKSISTSSEPVTSPAYLSILSENSRRHPHAPPIVSMFNPLREKVPTQAWRSGLTPVPSQRFRTPLFPPLERSRRRCNMKHGSGGESKIVFMNKKRPNCPTCKTDSFSKRLMLFKYPLERLDHLQHIERMNSLISPVRDEYAMDIEVHLPSQELDVDILDSPFLRDLDDFGEGMDDFFDKDGDPILVDDDEDTDMKGLALF